MSRHWFVPHFPSAPHTFVQHSLPVLHVSLASLHSELGAGHTLSVPRRPLHQLAPCVGLQAAPTSRPCVPGPPPGRMTPPSSPPPVSPPSPPPSKPASSPGPASSSSTGGPPQFLQPAPLN